MSRRLRPQRSGDRQQRQNNEDDGGERRFSPSPKRRRVVHHRHHHETFGRYYDCDYENKDEMERTLFVFSKPETWSRSRFTDQLLAMLKKEQQLAATAESPIILSCSDVRGSKVNQVVIETDSVESSNLILKKLDGKRLERSSESPLKISRHFKVMAEYRLRVGLGCTRMDDGKELASFLERMARDVGLVKREGSPFLLSHSVWKPNEDGGHRSFILFDLRSKTETRDLLHLNGIKFQGCTLGISASNCSKGERFPRNPLNWSDFLRSRNVVSEGGSKSENQSEEVSTTSSTIHSPNASSTRKINFQVAPEIKEKHGNYEQIIASIHQHQGIDSQRMATSTSKPGVEEESISPSHDDDDDDDDDDEGAQSKSPSTDSRMGSTLSENLSRRGIPRTVEASVNSSLQDKEEEIKGLKEEIQQLLDRIDTKNEDLKASREECTRSREEFKKLEAIESNQRDELQQQRREADKYRDECDRLNGILQRKDKDLEDAERKVTQLRDDIRRLEREKSKEAKAADVFEADYKDLKKQYDADVDRLEGHVRRLERRCTNMQDDLNRQKEIADDYKQKYESGSSANAARQVEHETATSAINDEVAKLREENLRLERMKREEVATQRKKADKYQKMYHETSSDFVESELQYKKLIGDLFESKRSLSNAKDALDDEREKRREAEARVKQLEEELSKAVK